jgi:Flp pilus assembly protein TadG
MRCRIADIFRQRIGALRTDQSGAAGVSVAILFSMLLLTIAVSLDFALGTAEQTREQNALDAAALAASDLLGATDQDTAGPTVARAYFAANLTGRSAAELDNVKLDADKGEVKASSSVSLMTRLMGAFGTKSLEISTRTTVSKGDGTIELALVLDNSGSMAGTYISALKTAAKSLTSTLFTGVDGTGKLSIGVVPFAGSVNVGKSYDDAPWMDLEGRSSVHYENVSPSRNRLQLFSDMSTDWGGCVEVRPGSLAVTDAPAVPGNPDSYFVPSFAPDEPDSVNNGDWTYSNSYLVDDGGSCPRQPVVCTNYDRRGRCTRTEKTPLAPETAQARICKYAGQTPSGGSGPNANCTTKALLPLSTSKSSVESHIDTLTASGSTNIGEGLMWGWRVLSPSEPFTGGRAYNATGNRKIIVLMTDGENTYYQASNHNKSTYGAYGYGVKNRLGATYTNAAMRSAMNTNLVGACANAKAAGIIVYTVAFRLESDPTTRSLLNSCASSSDKYFAASNNDALIDAFKQIAKQLNQLRVTS